MAQTINFCNLYLKKNLEINYLKKKLVKLTMENETLHNIFDSYLERYYELHRRKDKLQAECNRLTKVYGKNFCSLTIA